jgi:hypothetical protein
MGLLAELRSQRRLSAPTERTPLRPVREGVRDSGMASKTRQIVLPDTDLSAPDSVARALRSRVPVRDRDLLVRDTKEPSGTAKSLFWTRKSPSGTATSPSGGENRSSGTSGEVPAVPDGIPRVQIGFFFRSGRFVVENEPVATKKKAKTEGPRTTSQKPRGSARLGRTLSGPSVTASGPGPIREGSRAWETLH